MIVGKLAVIVILLIIAYMFGCFRGYDDAAHICNWGTGWDSGWDNGWNLGFKAGYIRGLKKCEEGWEELKEKDREES